MILRAISAIVIICAGRAAFGQSTRPSNFVAREWAVLVIDAAQNQMNPQGMVFGTLPDFVDSSRTSAPADSRNAPQAAGVIRLFGPSSATVDVMVTKANGDFLASWPKAETRATQILWRNLKLSPPPSAPAGIQDIDSANWFATLRTVDSDFLSLSDSSAEKFLLYDVTMSYDSPLAVTNHHDFDLQIANSGKVALHDLTLYQGENGTWRETELGDLPPSSSATTQSAATTQPAALHVTLNRVPSTQPAELAGQWKPILINAGVLPSDADTMVQILTQSAFDPRRLTAVYLLDPDELDRILPLEIVPEPNKTIRVALVIVRNADPASGTEVDDLIADLGDPVWAKRQAAYDSLQKLGETAVPKLQKALQSKDMEIVWRAERLVAAAQRQPH